MSSLNAEPIARLIVYAYTMTMSIGSSLVLFGLAWKTFFGMSQGLKIYVLIVGFITITIAMSEIGGLFGLLIASLFL
jgi:hypothetical protein